MRIRVPIDPALPEPCHDFDFLLGEWSSTVTTSRRSESLAGTWSARHLHGGRMVLDDLVVFDAHGEPIRAMATLRTWVPERQIWTATFLYALERPTMVELVGARTGDEIHLSALDVGSGESAAVRFYAIEDRSFEWEQRDEDGRVVVHIASHRVGRTTASPIRSELP